MPRTGNKILKEKNKVRGRRLLTSRFTVKLHYSRQCGTDERRNETKRLMKQNKVQK